MAKTLPNQIQIPMAEKQNPNSQGPDQKCTEQRNKIELALIICFYIYKKITAL